MVSLVLASQSPRRRILLESLGLTFRIENPTSEELTRSIHGPESLVQENAAIKVSSIAQKLSPGEIGIGADTLVALDGQVLGKPKDTQDASRMLKLLSGKTHDVYTGLALLAHGQKPLASVTQSRVKFRSISEDEMELYIKSAEPMDKAGSYAIQGIGVLFVDQVDGSYTNVMGLPLETLLRQLETVSGRSVLRWNLKVRGGF